MSDTALRDAIVGVLEEHRLKSSRVKANLVLQVIGGRQPVLSEATVPDATDTPPDPPRWSKYAARNAKLLEQGVATTRNRTDAAIRALGLEPHEVRAVVIESSHIHVFRWTDASDRIGIGLPIMPDDPEEAA